MKPIATLILAAVAVLHCGERPFAADEKPPSISQINGHDYREFLRKGPLALKELLGKHLNEVVPGQAWGGLSR
jgi:hypothetical protein